MGEGKEEAAERQFCLKECAHTHITRSDYLEKLVARQKLGVGIVTCCFAETKGTNVRVEGMDEARTQLLEENRLLIRIIKQTNKNYPVGEKQTGWLDKAGQGWTGQDKA